MKVLSVVGARPQIVKVALVSAALARRGHHGVLVHTGQQTAAAMTDDLLLELGVPAPAHRLRVTTTNREAQIEEMTRALAPIVRHESPDWVLVFGDTNSTVAGARAASDAGVALAHVEAGVRSFDHDLPEEHNRIETDRRSAVLCCPGPRSVAHLANEGITAGVHVTGDVMYDAFVATHARMVSTPPAAGRAPASYFLATVHRRATTDDPAALTAILQALDALPAPVLMPIHPRTAERLGHLAFRPAGALELVPPMGHADLLASLASARAVLTDSGGVQKEAYWSAVPCLTLRRRTEWTETVDAGWNALVGGDPDRIVEAARMVRRPLARPSLFEEPGAPGRIVALLEAADRPPR